MCMKAHKNLKIDTSDVFKVYVYSSIRKTSVQHYNSLLIMSLLHFDFWNFKTDPGNYFVRRCMK
jgi:uncharacterized membrane protein